MKKIILLVFVISLISPWAALAGVEMVTEHKDNNGTAMLHKASIAKDRVRVEMAGESIMIFRKDKQLIWFVQPKRNSYIEMNEAQLKAIQAKMGQAQQMMAAQLKNMPANQRAAMEKVMGKNNPLFQNLQQPKKELKLVAKKQKCLQWTCDQYALMVNGKKDRDIWLAPFDVLGMSADDFQAVKDMSEFMESMINKTVPGIQITSTDFLHNMPGFPVKHISYKAGGLIDATMNLKSVSSKTPDAALFELPSGLKKQKAF